MGEKPLRLTLLIWLLVLMALCLSPLEMKARLHTTGRFHTAGHIVAFLVTAFLLTWNSSTKRQLLARFALGVAIAVSTEGLEHAVYGNSMEWGDVLLDSLGIVLGVLLTVGLQSARPSQAS